MQDQKISNRVFIRTDSSSRIGSGHVFRCLALADELKRQGATVEFVCRDLPGNIGAIIKQRGFAIHLLPPYQEGLPMPWKEDATLTLEIIGEKNKSHLVVDHYLLDRRWESSFFTKLEKVLVVDDLANRPHECDLLLDSSYFLNAKSRYDSLIRSLPLFLLGPSFVPLKSSFASGRKERDFSCVKNILLFFGAADHTKSALLVMDALQSLSLPEIKVNLVLGMSDPNREYIRERVEKIPGWQCYDFVSDMLPLLQQADLYIGSGGMISWERCCMALPSIVIAVAANQEPSCRALAEFGIIRYLGTAQEVSSQAIQEAIYDLCRDSSIRKNMGEKSARLVDGRGAVRVARALLVKKLSLKKAKKEDCEIVYTWRNALETRIHSLDPSLIDFLEHQRWYEAILENPNRALLLAYSGDDAVGVLRFDKKESSALVSIYLNPARKGMGYGPEILRAGSFWVKQNWPELVQLDAEILPNNLASIAAFESAGYVKRDKVYSLDL